MRQTQLLALFWAVVFFTLAGCSSQPTIQHFPKGITPGAWQTESGWNNIIFLKDGRVIFEDDSISVSQSLVDDKTFKFVRNKRGDLFNVVLEFEPASDGMIMTVSYPNNPAVRDRVEQIKKIKDDTSSGDYKKDLQGEWTIDGIGDGYEYNFKGDVVVISQYGNNKGECSYSIVEDKITTTCPSGELKYLTGKLLSTGDTVYVFQDDGGILIPLERKQG
jgi:hypothetical protein